MVSVHPFPGEREPEASVAHRRSPSKQAADAATIGTPAGANGVSASVMAPASAAAWSPRRLRR